MILQQLVPMERKREPTMTIHGKQKSSPAQSLPHQPRSILEHLSSTLALLSACPGTGRNNPEPQSLRPSNPPQDSTRPIILSKTLKTRPWSRLRDASSTQEEMRRLLEEQ